MNFLNAGIPVKMLEMKQEALDRGVATIKQELRSPGQEGQAQAGQVRSSAWRC
jgi:3-hydroxyacyl-CoA dehydrogenase